MKALQRQNPGFTLIEMMIGIVMLGVVLIAFGGIFTLFQKSAAQSRQFADSQQNARFAIDYLTQNLRQAGVGTDYTNGQMFLVHAGPYQVAINADADRGETLTGEGPLTAVIGPTNIPSSGSALYSPTQTFDSPAETVVLTLDSDEDGVISSSDQGDDPEESGTNPNLYVLVKRSYGASSSANALRKSNLAMLRGPGAYPDNTHPAPLFKYLYDHDLDFGTPDRLWGDGDNNGTLSDSEITSLVAMPDTLLGRIRKIRVTATCEASQYNPKFESSGGYLSVMMRSEVTVRNATRRGSVIVGRVFHDVNGDGVQDPNENGIPNVTVRILGGNTVLTNGYGVYKFNVNAGTYTVRETDPSGFTSTTPNDVAVSLTEGQSKVVDYGDQTSGSLGYIKGTVFDDLDQDGLLTAGELGIEGVLVELDTGEQITTNSAGRYSFVVMLGSYDVSEVDPEGMGSTTPNTVTASVAIAGDSTIVNFGDVENPIKGVIEGYVFEDDNRDGIRDLGDAGIPGVTITVSGPLVDSVTTDQAGFYSFWLGADVYDVSEADPSGYVSTTLNLVKGIVIVPDTAVTIDFGDILDHTVSFGEAGVANIDGAMALALDDFGEDGNFDTDIIVGTPTTGGAGNVVVFLNQWVSAATPQSQLFAATPSYFRDAGQTVTTVGTVDYTNDGKPDVITGLDYSAGLNIQTWSNDGTGMMSMSPDTSYLSVFPTVIQTSKLVDVDGNGLKDIVLGLKSPFGTFTGGFQVFKANASGLVASQAVSAAGGASDVQLGEIWAIEAADFDNDGDQDLVVGSHTSDYTGVIDFYENVSGAGVYSWYARYEGGGAVNDIEVVDVVEDTYRDLDVIVAVSTAANAGRVYVWEHGLTSFGEPATSGEFTYPTTPAWPSATWDLGAEVLTLETAQINLDIFPDVFVGTSSPSFYQGDLFLVISGDYQNAMQLNGGTMGSVGTLDLGDFDKDGRVDVVAATRTSSSLGQLVVFYNTSN